MIILANLLGAIAMVLDLVLGALIFIVFIRAILSWVNPDPYNPIVRFLTASTDPLLNPLRRYIPPLGGSLDLTPLVLVAILYFLRAFLVATLVDYAAALRHSAKYNPGLSQNRPAAEIIVALDDFSDSDYSSRSEVFAQRIYADLRVRMPALRSLRS